MIEYVLVHASCVGHPNRVLLILKDRPSWMSNKLNLLGGKIEQGEKPIEAAIRELKEESGLVPYVHCSKSPGVFGKIIAENCIIWCCSMEVKGETISPRPEETEKVNWYDWDMIKEDSRLMPNLKIIVPLLQMRTSDWIIIEQSTISDDYHKVLVQFKK